MIGTSLGPYQIIEQLGAGGMGEVYLGEDTRLGRNVAIKVLPAEFASDPERLARFEQEARAAAALNHPHIAVVHDIGREGDTHFIVQEYLQGQTLRERLDKGALPLDKALDLAIEVGEALIAAHKAGIIHRDLKPDNIFVTEEGHTKVLDFGLAKLTEVAAPAGSELSMSPTMLGTVAGQVMGTAGYMAPEQVNGEQVDHRADLFGFGCVLYEAVTGKRAFAGENVHDTLSRIISQQPAPLGDVRRDLPAKLDWIVGKTLAKVSPQRYQHADDLVVDLQGLRLEVQSGAVGTEKAAAEKTGSEQQPRSGLPATTLGITAVVAITALALGLWLGRLGSSQRSAAIGEIRGRINVPAGMHLPGGLGRIVRISRDGKTLVYVAGNDSGRRLYRRELDSLASVQIDGTEHAREPFLSPNGEWVGFNREGMPETMNIVPIAGGEPQTVCSDCIGGAWSDDGYIYFRRRTDFSIWRVSAFSGAEPRLVSAPMPEQGLGAFQHVAPLPGGKAVLVQASDAGLNSSVGVFTMTLDTNAISMLEAGARDPLYSLTGHVLYVRDSTLMALPFDPETLQPTGEAVRVVENVRVENGGAVQADVSENGVLVYVAGADAAGTRLVIVDREGDAQPIVEEPQVYRLPRASPNGARILLTIQDGDATDLFVVDTDGGTPQALTTDGVSSQGIWLDNETIAFATASEGSSMIKSVRVDRTGAEGILVSNDKPVFPGAWSAETRKLLYSQDEGNRDFRIYEVGDDGASSTMISPERGFSERDPALSPDGKWLAYVSRRDGVDDVYVRPYPGSAAGVPVTLEGGWATGWSREPNELLYLGHGFGWPLISVSLETEPELDAVDHVTLFNSIRFWSNQTAGFSALPNGDLVMLEILVTDQVSFVSDWLAEMESRGRGGR